MNSEEARKLLGGYATDSLTEAERTALFQAALQDQELFEQLAGEHTLKEVLQQPGARQRLLIALEPARRHRAWLWAGVAATAAIAVGIAIVVSQRTPRPPQETAQVLKSPEPVTAPVSPPVPVPARERARAGRKAGPVPAPTLAEPVGEPAPEFKAKDSLAVAENAQEARTRSGPVQPRAAAGAVSQFATAPATNTFAFSYSVGPDGFVQIIPAAPGYLSVSGNDAVIFPSSAVSPAMLVRIAIPSGVTSLVIGFSREQGINGTPVRRDDASGTISDQDPPNGKILIQLFLTPGTR
jgi:hypothetical protein